MRNSVWCLFFLLDKQEKIQEASSRVDMAAFAIIILTAVVIAAVAYRSFSYKSKLRLPKKHSDRYAGYQRADAVITRVEKVSYSVKPYSGSYNGKQDIGTPFYLQEIEHPMVRAERDRYGYFDTLMPKGKLFPDEPKETIEKIKYEVSFEFCFGSSTNKFYGHFCVYEKKDDIQVGKTIGIKYDPLNPQMNFTAYNLPLGVYEF